MKLSRNSKRLLPCWLLLTTLGVFGACGKRRPPLPPAPSAPVNQTIVGFQIGNQIRLEFTAAARRAFNQQQSKRIEIYRLAESSETGVFLTQDEFAGRASLIATVAGPDLPGAVGSKAFFVDTLNVIGLSRRLRYSVRAVNENNQRGAFSNFVLIEPSARVAAAPTLLAAEVTAPAVTLRWQPVGTGLDNAPVTVVGYNVYRATTTATADAAVEPRLLAQTADAAFADTTFRFGDDYNYFVRAIVTGENGAPVESNDSNVLNVKPLDTFAPAAPEGLTVAGASGQLSLFFTANVEPDLRGYLVYRSPDQNRPLKDWQRLTVEPINTTTFQDARVEPGTQYFYYVTAVDQTGNSSQPSPIVSETVP